MVMAADDQVSDADVAEVERSAVPPAVLARHVYSPTP